MRRAGLDPRAIDAAYSLHEPEQSPLWWAAYDRIAARLGTGLLVALVGTYGAGKSVMAAVCIRRRLRDNCPGPHLYTTAPQLFRELHDGRSEGRSERAVLRPFWDADLLVIDEAHERAQTDYEDRRLREIIDVRYGHGRDTILISNLLAGAFCAAIGDAAVDRLAHSGGVVECDWPSFRRPA